jgi:mRNA-degrading endonuclease toxin of MazEF toxin-antitoxin module
MRGRCAPEKSCLAKRWHDELNPRCLSAAAMRCSACSRSQRAVARRPALIVPNKRAKRRLANTIMAQITTNRRYGNDPTQLLIPWGPPEGRHAGVLHDAVVSGNHLATVHAERIQWVIGHLPEALRPRIDECLKGAFGLR